MVSFKEFIQEKREPKRRYSNEFKRYFRKLVQAESEAERSELLVKLVLLIKLMSHKEVAHALRNI